VACGLLCLEARSISPPEKWYVPKNMTVVSPDQRVTLNRLAASSNQIAF